MKPHPDQGSQEQRAVPGLAPPLPAALSEEAVVVDGEQFVLRERVPESNAYVYDYDWLTGPNPGYGFSSSGPKQSPEDHMAAIRVFLRGIDPGTGYLAD